MNTADIDLFLKTDPITKDIHKGAYACDDIPNWVWIRPYALVLNTGPISSGGRHWVAVFAPLEGQAIYFDSFGLPPYIKKITRFLANNFNSVKYSKTQLQPVDSKLCGMYCIRFIKEMATGTPFEAFLTNFMSTPLFVNDLHLFLQ